MLLYKYRSKKQLQFTLDILLNRRLYAAQFDTLNDPMEGFWHYGGRGTLWPDEIRDIYNYIEKYRIVSLSLNPVSTLMWSHYADSHRGLSVGVEVIGQDDILVLPIRYSSNYVFDGNAPDIGVDILTKKAIAWHYEHEYRVLTHASFISVLPQEIIFGVRADKEFVELVERVAHTFCPEIRINKLRIEDLDTFAEPPPHYGQSNKDN